MKLVRITTLEGVATVTNDEIDDFIERKGDVVETISDGQNRRPREVAASLATAEKLKDIDWIEVRKTSTEELVE